jgi:glycosyl transferase family 87
MSRTTRPPTTIRRAELRTALRAAALLTPVYLLAAAVPQGGLFRGREYRDVGLYGDYAHAFLDGRIPYRDVFVEYPPGAFAVFLPPAFLPDDWYRHAFKLLMALLGVVMLFVAALILVRLGASSRRLYGALGALALSPLAIGPVSLNTYDLWPALLVAGAVCALLYGLPTLGFGLLGVAVTAKLYPLALLPVFCLAVGRRRLGRPLLAFAAVVLVVVGPFALVGWDGLWDSVDAQAERALQLESLGGALLVAADKLGFYDAEVVTGSTAALSRDLGGSLADGVAAAMTVLQVAAIVLAAWFFARGQREGERLVAAAAATLAGFLAFARFISPQYLVWLLPLVALVVPPAGVAAAAVLGAALVLGQLWFFHYRELFGLENVAWLVLARDLCLVALYGILVVALLRLRTTIPSSSSAVDQSPLRSSRASGIAAVEADDRRSR